MSLLSVLIQLVAGISFVLNIALVTGRPSLPFQTLVIANATENHPKTQVYDLKDTEGLLINKRGALYGPTNDYTNASFILEDCKDSCVRTCESDSRVALWKWRLHCDIDGNGRIFKSDCWGRAPTAESCCGKKKKKHASCKAFWPMNDWEAGTCRHDCLWLQTATCNGTRDNPSWCKCMYKHCDMDD